MQSDKTFSTRSNARRNALKAGVPAEQVEIVAHGKGDAVRFGWRQIDTKVLADVFPAPAKAKPAKQKTTVKAQPPEVRNGVKRPRGPKCAAVWSFCDSFLKEKGTAPTLADAREWAQRTGANEKQCRR